MKGLDPSGNVIEGNGTSYSTPRIVQKFAGVFDEMVDKDMLLAKAILIHSARMNARDSLDVNPQNMKYYGFGMPSDSIDDILLCSEDEITLVFKQKVKKGTHLEMMDFPFPKSLIRGGKCYGEIGMTLVYNPILDEKYGCEYCRANMDVSFGIYKYEANGKLTYNGQVPLDRTWDEQYERARVENGFKWSPIKSYYRKIKNGIYAGDGWKIRIDLTERNEISIIEQEFDKLKAEAEKGNTDSYKVKYEALKEEFEKFKGDVSAKETKSAKETALRATLKKLGVPEKHIGSIVKVTDLGGIELDEKGAVKNADAHEKQLREEWSDLIPTEEQRPVTPETPPTGGKTPPTRAEIMKIKDTSERQKAIAENIELFNG